MALDVPEGQIITQSVKSRRLGQIALNYSPLSLYLTRFIETEGGASRPLKIETRFQLASWNTSAIGNLSFDKKFPR